MPSGVDFKMAQRLWKLRPNKWNRIYSICSNPWFSLVFLEHSRYVQSGTWNRHVFSVGFFHCATSRQRPPVDVVFQRMPRSNAAPLRLYQGGSWSLACRPWFKPFKLDMVQTCTLKVWKIYRQREVDGKESMCTMGIYRILYTTELFLRYIFEQQDIHGNSTSASQVLAAQDSCPCGSDRIRVP